MEPLCVNSITATNLPKRNRFPLTNIAFPTQESAAESPQSLQQELFANLISFGGSAVTLDQSQHSWGSPISPASLVYRVNHPLAWTSGGLTTLNR